MKILMSELPESAWWGKGTPVYPNNWSMELGRIPDAALTKKEHVKIIKTLKKYTDLTVIPFPKKLDSTLYKHDAVFVRDAFISNQKGKIVLSNFTAKARQPELDHIKKLLKRNAYSISTLSQSARAEGGEFYYIVNGDILLAGLSRNNKKGVEETARLLGAKKLFIVVSNCFHLDAVFTVLLDKNGKLAGFITSLKMIKNAAALQHFAKEHNVPVLDINPKDTVGFDGKGSSAVNCLPLPGVLVGGEKFATPGIELKLKKLEVKHVISQVTQFGVSGGGVHCLTNELGL